MPPSTHQLATSKAEFLATAERAPRGARCPVEVRVRVSDPYEAYRRARPDGGPAPNDAETPRPAGVYLETTGGQAGWGYFAVDPVRLLRVGPSATPREGDQSASLTELATLLDGEQLVRGDCDVPYPCGAFGWLSYDVARELESLPDDTIDDRGLPRLQLGVFDRVAAWKEPRPDGETTLRITACPVVGEDPGAAYDRGRHRAQALAEAAVAGDATIGTPPVAAADATFESDCSRPAYTDRVRRVREYVRDGETFQANVSQRLRAPAAVHPVTAFAAIRRVNPAPYSGLVELPGVDLVSASPELLLDVSPTDDEAPPDGSESSLDGDSDATGATRRLLTEPIAGTRPRGDAAAADDAYESDLLCDEKERAEHAMLVDLERNDLGKVSAYGSVHVPEYRRVDRYAEVMHLVSAVEGQLREDCGLLDAVAAVFPGGTVTGAPKPRTMAIIDELEETRRGPYTGSIGVFGFDDRATLNMVIRTLVRRDEEYFLRVGAGIVHDSDPLAEYEETLAKARALLTAMDEALGDRAELTVASTASGGG